MIVKRLSFIFLVTFAHHLQVLAAPGEQVIADLNAKIDQIQYQIDEQDGLADGIITHASPQIAERATLYYITYINQLQKQINDADQPWMKTRDQLRVIRQWLVDTEPTQYDSPYYLGQIELKYNLYTGTNLDNVENELKTNPKVAIEFYESYKDFPFSQSVIETTYNENPDLFVANLTRFKDAPEVLTIFESKVSANPTPLNQWIDYQFRADPKKVLMFYDKFKDYSFSSQIIKQVAKTDTELFMKNIGTFRSSPEIQGIVDNMVRENPIKMKRWVDTDTEMNQILNNSTQPTTRLFISLFHQFGRASKSFYLMEDISNGRITPERANEISQDVKQFRDYLINLAQRSNNIIAAEAVEERLTEESLRVIRPINDLHENHDYSVRFKSANDFTAQELYTYMVYTQEEIFTSTFNGFYERMMSRMKEEDTYTFLANQNFNKYRTFIKMLAGYNQLSDYLSHMSKDQQKQLLTRFVSHLEEGSLQESLTDAVDVADTFGSVNNSELRTFFTSQLNTELNRVKTTYNQHGIRIYSLLNVILAQSNQNSDNWINQLVAEYDIPKINELDYSALKNSDGKVIIQVNFFDDDDGKASYNSWIPAYRNESWTIQDKNSYVLITSSNKNIQIYANKPEFEFKGKDDIQAVFRTRGISPTITIHRGHSFYVDTTIESLTPNTRLVFLGSCGGYHKLTSVLDRSPEVQIISSKQIGTMAINDPLIRLLNKNLLNGSDIKWQSFWNTLEGQIKATGSTNYERFQDYIPPHQNLGAIFIMAYNRMGDNPL